MVPAQGGRSKPATEIALKFEHFSLRKFLATFPFSFRRSACVRCR
jgi:hypothetical protein